MSTGRYRVAGSDNGSYQYLGIKADGRVLSYCGAMDKTIERGRGAVEVGGVGAHLVPIRPQRPASRWLALESGAPFSEPEVALP